MSFRFYYSEFANREVTINWRYKSENAVSIGGFCLNTACSCRCMLACGEREGERKVIRLSLLPKHTGKPWSLLFITLPCLFWCCAETIRCRLIESEQQGLLGMTQNNTSWTAVREQNIVLKKIYEYLEILWTSISSCLIIAQTAFGFTVLILGFLMLWSSWFAHICTAFKINTAE